jgi:ABC-2 type transport system permease protein
MRTLLWKEVREQWRTYRFLIVATILTLFGLLGPLTARYLPQILAALPDMPPELAGLMPTPDASMAVAEYLDNVSQFGALLALLVPMGAVVGEKTRGTAEITLSKPVSRAIFLVAKFLALGVTFLGGLILAGLGGYYYTGLLFEWLPLAGFVALNGLVLVYLLSYVSITLLASTIARSQVAAAGMAFGALILFSLLGAIPSAAGLLPSALLKWGGALALGQPIEPAWNALGAALSLIAVVLTCAWLLLRRQEL